MKRYEEIHKKTKEWEAAKPESLWFNVFTFRVDEHNVLAGLRLVADCEDVFLWFDTENIKKLLAFLEKPTKEFRMDFDCADGNLSDSRLSIKQQKRTNVYYMVLEDYYETTSRGVDIKKLKSWLERMLEEV